MGEVNIEMYCMEIGQDGFDFMIQESRG